MRPATVALLFILQVCQAAEPAGEHQLVILRNSGIELGILPAAAGRVVLLRQPGGPNRLASDPTQWSPEAIPAPTALGSFATVGGHMTWLAPQADWWRQQLGTTEHVGTWPPDPWLIHARYETVAVGPDHLVLRGPASPYSGVALEKTYRLLPDGVRLTTRATNARTTAVRWALWSNLHPLASAVPYVPLPTTDRLTVIHDGKQPALSGILGYRLVDGLLTVPMHQTGAPGVRVVEAKFLLQTASPWLFAVGADWALAVCGAGTLPDQAAPGEAPLALYLLRHPDDPTNDLLELEHQGEYRTLTAGATLTLTESWHLSTHTAGSAPAAQAAYVRQWLSALQARRDLPEQRPDETEKNSP